MEQGADKDKATNIGTTPLLIAAENNHVAVLRYLMEQGADVNKASVTGYAPLHAAVERGHIAAAVCLMESGLADLSARTRVGRRRGLMDLADTDAMKQAIVKVEERRRNHGYKRAVIPNPTAAEQASVERARLEAEGEGEVGGVQGQVQATDGVLAEEVDDDSGSDEEHEVAFRKSLKRKRSES